MRRRVKNSNAYNQTRTAISRTSNKIQSSSAYNKATDSRAGKAAKNMYGNVRNSSKQRANASIQRYNGNTKKAMAATAAKSFGSSAAVNVGGRVVSALLLTGAATAAASGHIRVATAAANAANLTRKGTRAASAVMAAYGAMNVADVYKQSKKS